MRGSLFGPKYMKNPHVSNLKCKDVYDTRISLKGVKSLRNVEATIIELCKSKYVHFGQGVKCKELVVTGDVELAKDTEVDKITVLPLKLQLKMRMVEKGLIQM